MTKTRSTILVGTMALMLAATSALIFAQQGAPGPGGGAPGGGGNFGGGPGGGPGGGGNTPQDRAARAAEFRQRAADALKQALGASDDEWKVLQPRIDKVQTLQGQSLQARIGGMMGMMGGGPGGGGGRRGNRGGGNGGPGGGNADPAQPTSEIATALAELNKVLADPSAGPDIIKAKLAAVRAARKKAADELAKAQQELRDVLNVKQEAQLVAMGLLD